MDSDEAKELAPFERQMQFTECEAFMKDWSDVRMIVRELEKTLIREYKLVNLEPRDEDKPTVV